MIAHVYPNAKINVFSPGKTGKLKVKGNEKMLYDEKKGMMNEEKVCGLMDELARVA